MKRLLFFLTLAGLTAWLAGCNTMAGFGQDMQQGGKAIEDKASEEKAEE